MVTTKRQIRTRYREAMLRLAQPAQLRRLLGLVDDHHVPYITFYHALRGTRVPEQAVEYIEAAWERWANLYLKRGVKETFGEKA